MKEAPLFADALRLATWIEENLPASTPLTLRVHARSLDLLEHVTAALTGLDREAEIALADRAVACLRSLLRLAFDSGVFGQGQLLHLASLLDTIGRQLGGWQRRLVGDNLAPRRR